MISVLSRINGQVYAVFMTIGFFLSYVVFELLTHWIQVFAVIYDKPDLGYHDLPLYIHIAQEAVRWLVWAVLAIIALTDFYKKQFTRTAGYISGIIVAAVVIIVVSAYRFGAAMEAF